MWPPSTTQSATEDAPYRGIQNRTAGEIYSIASAIAQSTSRNWPSAKPPAIQNTADSDSQAVMRIAFSARQRSATAASRPSRKTVLPTCIAA